MTIPSGSPGAFFHRLIDYAGLFPPAALGLPEAVSNYRIYLDSSERWALGRFIGATPHVLGLTEEQVAMFSPETPLDISLVCKDPAADLPTVMEKVRGFGGRVSLGALEVALPVAADFKGTLKRNESAVSVFDRTDRRLPIFYELAGGEGWDGALPVCIGAIGEAQASGRSLGLKLRCGGLEPHLVPSPERVTAALAGAVAADIPIKFTAGLHHPFRHTQPNPFPPMHGYFNIFFAAFVAYLKRAPKSDIIPIVSEMERCDPVVGPHGVSWLGIELTADEIARARERFALSYGSCSFVEPIDDARSRGWL